jgi:hypothetical protein
MYLIVYQHLKIFFFILKMYYPPNHPNPVLDWFPSNSRLNSEMLANLSIRTLFGIFKDYYKIVDGTLQSLLILQPTDCIFHITPQSMTVICIQILNFFMMDRIYTAEPNNI